MHRTGVQTIGNDFGTDSAGSVVDHELVLDAGQRKAEHGVVVPLRKYLRVRLLVMKLRGELTERLKAIRQLRVALELAFERIGADRERAVGIRSHDDRIDIAVHEFVAVQHIEDRQSCFALKGPWRDVGIGGLVVDDRLATRVAGYADRFVHWRGNIVGGTHYLICAGGGAIREHRTGGREAQFLLGHLAAIHFCTDGLDVQRAKHADSDVTAASL